MIAAIWITTLLLLAAWTLAAWAMSTLLQGDAGWVDTLQRWLFDAPWREAIEVWLPGWSMTLQSLLDALQTLLAWLGGAAPWLVWIAWGLGALPLIGLAALLHVIVVLVRRDRAAAPPPPGAVR